MLIMHVGHFGGQPDSKMAAKSKRYSDFDETSRKRYDEQISIIDGIDPYTLKKSQLSSEFENFPHITYPDIVNYLLFAPSPYSRGDLKKFRSLESYNHFVCGWVRDVGMLLQNGKAIILGRVSLMY